MTSAAYFSRLLVFAGLCVLGASMTLWLLGRGGIWITIAAGVVPALALIGLAMTRPNRWGAWIALFTVPYFCVGTMDVIAGSGTLWLPMILASSALVTFFAALDAARRGV